MSNIYVQEPPTLGKVSLETTVGDIEIELWSRECPKACRNFVQLCMENYYAKTKFHRVVRDFVVQGGDPTGTGHGGDSVYGRPFKDEFHSRLRFCRRGLVAMANGGGKDDNGSQFFLTMGPTQELQNKHTIFGKVVGDTIYNMLKLQEGVVDSETDKPAFPHKITRCHVLINPFNDIQPRETIKLMEPEGDDDAWKKRSKKKSKMKATKNYKLLSFGDEAEDEQEDLTALMKSSKATSKSAHDLLNDPKMSSIVGEEFMETTTLKRKRSESSDHDQEEEESWELRTKEEQANSVRDKLKKPATKPQPSASNKLDGDDELEEVKEKKRKRQEVRKEIRQLQKDLRKRDDDDRPQVDDGKTEAVEERPTEEEKSNDMLLQFHQQQKRFEPTKAKNNAKKGSSEREQKALAMLAKFQQKLGAAVSASSEAGVANEDDDDDVEGDGWMSNTLKFQDADPVRAKDANTKGDDWFDIYDPRNPLNKRRREKKKK